MLLVLDTGEILFTIGFGLYTKSGNRLRKLSNPKLTVALLPLPPGARELELGNLVEQLAHGALQKARSTASFLSNCFNQTTGHK